MASVAPAACNFCAMPQAMERLLASPKTTAVLPAKSIILLLFLQVLKQGIQLRPHRFLEYQPDYSAFLPRHFIRPDRLTQRAPLAVPESASPGARTSPRNR